jgi:hypothetical protein
LSIPSPTVDYNYNYCHKDDGTNYYACNGTTCKNVVIVVKAIRAIGWAGAIDIAAIIFAVLAENITR